MKILVSACLLGIDCKYNGKNNKNDKIFCVGGPRASKQRLLANRIFSIIGYYIALLGLHHDFI